MAQHVHTLLISEYSLQGSCPLSHFGKHSMESYYETVPEFTLQKYTPQNKGSLMALMGP